MDKVTVAILAGGPSKRFGSEKALAEFQGKPLILHMVAIARKLSSEIMVVVSDEEQEEKLRNLIPDIRIVVDPPSEVKSAMAGVLTALEYSLTKYVLVLPVDSPLSRTELLKLLLRMSPGHGAVVPSWPSGWIEPLHAVYLAEHAYSHGLKLMEECRYKMIDLLNRLESVLYVSTETLKQFDPELITFTNFNTPKELKAAERTSPRK